MADQSQASEIRPTLLVIDESYLTAEATSTEQLADKLAVPAEELRFLDSSLDGIPQLSALLESSTALGSLQLLTTANSEGIVFGGQTLDTNGLLNNAQELLGWRTQLDTEAQFNIQAQGLDQFSDREEFGSVLDQLTPSNVSLTDQVDLTPVSYTHLTLPTTPYV